MSETLPIIKPIDLSGIENPHIRIALRDLQSMLIFTLQRQQLDIQALLEMMIDHHIGSLAEFKRYLARQKENARTGRIHDAIVAATQPPPEEPPPSALTSPTRR